MIKGTAINRASSEQQAPLPHLLSFTIVPPWLLMSVYDQISRRPLVLLACD